MNDVRNTSTSRSVAISEPAPLVESALMGLGLAALVIGALWLATQSERPAASPAQFTYVGNATLH